MFRVAPLLLLLALVVLPGAPWAHENVPGHPVQVHPHITQAQAAFDRLFWAIDDGALPLSTREETYEALARLERAIPPGDVHRQLQYRYMHCLIGFEHVATGATEYARDGVAAAQEAGDQASEAALRLCLGWQLLAAGSTGAAGDEFENAALLARSSHDFNVEGIALVQRGHLRMNRGEVALGLGDLLQAQEVFEEGKVEFQIRFNLLAIATAYRRIGDDDNAARYIDRVLSFGQAREDDLVIGSALVERGLLHGRQAEYGRAEADLRKALALFQRQGNVQMTGWVHLDLAGVHNGAGRPREALGAIEAAISSFARAGAAGNPGLIDFATGLARSALGQHPAALQAFDRALPALQEADDRTAISRLYRARAVSREALGDHAGALADLREHSRLHRENHERITDQQVLALSHGFDARYRELENARLRLEQQRVERLAAAERRKTPWRRTSIGLALVLALLLAILAVRQARQALRLRRMASTDPLTGAPNRRAIHAFGTRVLGEGNDVGATCVVVIDLDHFKQVNDRHGHAAGDQVLVRAVAAWNTVLRQGDRLGRTGGEEFIAVLPGAGEIAGSQVAERLLRATRAIKLDDLAPGLAVTASFGLACAGPGERSLDEVLARADAALYRAKANGRDRIEAAPPALPGGMSR